MLKINKKVEYALMALKFMAEEKAIGKITSAREICDKFNTPFDTTAKVMQAMNHHKILNSVKGTKGGYTLAKDLCEITYMELNRIVEKKYSQSICQSSKGLCELYDICNIINPIDRLNATLNNYLESLTIKDLFEMSFKEPILNLNNNASEKQENI